MDKTNKFSYIIRNSLIFLIMLLILNPNIGTGQAAEINDILLSEGNEFLYKNEHYFLDDQGNRIPDVDKFSKLVIENVTQTEDSSEVIWAKYDVSNFTRTYIEDHPEEWIFGLRYDSIMQPNNSISDYQLMFNSPDASMENAPVDLLTGGWGTYRMFYWNEMDHYENNVSYWADNNTVLLNTFDANIQSQKSRTFLATINREASILLNGSVPEQEEYYNISFDLKLYLVYGLKSNLLLSYNINFSIVENYYNLTTHELSQDVLRKIIFWNIQSPEILTEDYPITEVLDIPALDFRKIGYGALILIPLYFLYWFRKRDRHQKLLEISAKLKDEQLLLTGSKSNLESDSVIGGATND